LINANESDPVPDDPKSLSISQNNTDELNDTSNNLNYDLKHSDTRANIVKDLGIIIKLIMYNIIICNI